MPLWGYFFLLFQHKPQTVWWDSIILYVHPLFEDYVGHAHIPHASCWSGPRPVASLQGTGWIHCGPGDVKSKWTLEASLSCGRILHPQELTNSSPKKGLFQWEKTIWTIHWFLGFMVSFPGSINQFFPFSHLGAGFQTFIYLFLLLPGDDDPTLTNSYFSNGLVKNHQTSHVSLFFVVGGGGDVM